jgi:hypothetical protein
MILNTLFKFTISLNATREDLQENWRKFREAWETYLNDDLKYCKVALLLFHDIDFKTRCMNLTEQISSAQQQQQGLLSARDEWRGPSSYAQWYDLEIQIDRLGAELTELLKGQSSTLASSAGSRFSEERMPAEIENIYETIRNSWSALEQFKQDLDAFESFMKTHERITRITTNTDPLSWCNDMNSSIRVFKQLINQILQKNNELNALLRAAHPRKGSLSACQATLNPPLAI